MNFGIYLLSTVPDEHNQLVSSLAHNLEKDQLPFVFTNRVDSVSCQVVLYDEQLMVLKLAVPSLKAVRLALEEDADNIQSDYSWTE